MGNKQQIDLIISNLEYGIKRSNIIYNDFLPPPRSGSHV